MPFDPDSLAQRFRRLAPATDYGSLRVVEERSEWISVSVTSLTPQERDAFITATRRVYAQWKATIGADLVNKAEASIAARK
jgi:TRAP-type C4-dicarboxylate transport system substrate-binding protein